jgi:hypothetical protein
MAGGGAGRSETAGEWRETALADEAGQEHGGRQCRKSSTAGKWREAALADAVEGPLVVIVLAAGKRIQAGADEPEGQFNTLQATSVLRLYHIIIHHNNNYS